MSVVVRARPVESKIFNRGESVAKNQWLFYTLSIKKQIFINPQKMRQTSFR